MKSQQYLKRIPRISLGIHGYMKYDDNSFRFASAANIERAWNFNNCNFFTSNSTHSTNSAVESTVTIKFNLWWFFITEISESSILPLCWFFRLFKCSNSYRLYAFQTLHENSLKSSANDFNFSSRSGDCTSISRQKWCMYLHWMSNFQPSSSTSDGDMWLYALHDKYFPASVRLRTIDNVLVVRLPSLDVYGREVKRGKNQIKFPFSVKCCCCLYFFPFIFLPLPPSSYISLHTERQQRFITHVPSNVHMSGTSWGCRRLFRRRSVGGRGKDVGQGIKNIFQAFVMKWVKRKRKLFELIINQFFASPDMLQIQCMVDIRQFSTTRVGRVRAHIAS